MATTPDIGWQGTPVDLNAAAAALAQQFEDAANGGIEIQKYVNSVGANVLATLTGWTQQEVTTFMSWCGYLHDFGMIFKGQLAQSGEFDFEGALAQLIGPPQ